MAAHRRLATAVTAALVGAITIVGCAAGDAPPPAGVRPDGFPTGVFAKSFDDEQFGPMRLSWVFDADGNWAEVPESTAGRSLAETGPARGHYTVDGDLLSITVDSPTFWGDHQHRWRLEGDRLITSFEDSEIPEDEGFFEMLDQQPWVRVP